MRRLNISRNSWIALVIVGLVAVLAFLQEDYCDSRAEAGLDAHAFGSCVGDARFDAEGYFIGE